ncbi:hypothetical protein ACV3PA_02740 [Exiguobacterium acetylicum]
MDLSKKLREIEQHFEKITNEEFERNLLKAGFDEIEHSSSSHMQMLAIGEFQTLGMEQVENTVTYSSNRINYKFDILPNKTTESLSILVAS